MTQATLEAGVVSEKRILRFSSHPPSSFGAHHLPWAVNQSRGDRGFAMNQQTQLQLSVKPYSSSMATSFNGLPSPVAINKSLGVFSCVSAERLALAVRLARRDIKNGNAHCPLTAPAQQHTVHGQYTGSNMEVHGKTEPCQPANVGHHPHPNALPHENLSEHAHINTDASANPPLHVKEKGCTTGNQSKPVSCQPISESHEIVRLRDELQRQINVLKRWSGNQRTPKPHCPQVKGQTGRVWMEEKEGSEEREERRRSEQAARDSRMIYNLKQQVVSLQCDIDQLDGPGREGHMLTARKANAVRRLSAAHRAALRTLANYQGHPSQHIPPELALLLLQLNLMSSRLGVHSESCPALEQVTEQVKCAGDDPLLDRDQQVGSVPPHPKVQPRKKKPNSHKQSGHKLVKRSSTHSWRAVSSQGKHHNPPLHRSTPAPSNKWTNQLSCKAPLPPLTSKRTNLLSHNVAPPPTLTSKRTNQLSDDAPPSPLTDKQTDQSSNTIPPSLLTKAPPTAPVKPQSPWKPLSEVCHASDESSSVGSSVDGQTLVDSRQREKVSVINSSGRSSLSPANPSNSDAMSLQPKSDYVPAQQLSALANVSVQRKKVAVLLDRLQELEAESDAIRERWTTIAYEDPLIMHSVHVDTHQKQETGKDLSLSPLTPDMLSSISKYKDRYSHYLNLTGVVTQGGFDPWTLAERLADKLLEDQVSAIAREVEQVCDSCVDTLYGREFAKPPTETT